MNQIQIFFSFFFVAKTLIASKVKFYFKDGTHSLLFSWLFVTRAKSYNFKFFDVSRPKKTLFCQRNRWFILSATSGESEPVSNGHWSVVNLTINLLNNLHTFPIAKILKNVDQKSVGIFTKKKIFFFSIFLSLFFPILLCQEIRYVFMQHYFTYLPNHNFSCGLLVLLVNPLV